MFFKDIPGNNDQKDELISSVQNKRIGHSYLFYGQQGNAKLAMALAYAAYINCDKKTEIDSCGRCETCIKHKKLIHPDLHLVFPVPKQNNFKKTISENFINQWRGEVLENPYLSINDWLELLAKDKKTIKKVGIYKDESESINKKTTLKNYQTKHKVFIIWMAEKMNTEAANKLLKLLEEPPAGTVFILTSENTDQLLKTIISRVQKIKIPRFSISDIIEYFDRKKINTENIKSLIHTTNRDLGLIKKNIQEKEEKKIFIDLFAEWMRLLYKTDVVQTCKWVDKTSLKQKNQQILFVSRSIEIIRSCLMWNFATPNSLNHNKEEVTFISKFSKFINEENAILIVDKLEETINAINRNGNTKIVLFETSLEIMRLLKIKIKI